MTQDNLIAYLKQIATFTQNDKFKFFGKEHLVLHYGRFFTSFSKDSFYKGTKKQCFMNAFNLSQQFDLTYCEGFATTHELNFPVDHAWCIDKQNNIIDNTWDNGNLYFGIPFSDKFVLETALATRVYGIFDFEIRKYFDGFEQWQLADGYINAKL